MKRKFVSLILVVVFVLNLTSVFAFAAQNEITIIVNGEKINFDVEPFIEEGRTMVPMRAIFEALGADVSWDDESQSAFAKKGADGISFIIGDNIIYDSTFFSMSPCEVAPKLVKDRTFVPLRAISNAFDCDVNWDESTKTVTVTEKHPDVEFTYKTEQIVLDTDDELAKIVVNYTYPVVTDGKDFLTQENVTKLNEIIESQRKDLFDVNEYADTFAEERFVIIDEKLYGYPEIKLDFTTKLYTSEKYGTVSVMSCVNIPWTGALAESETFDKNTLAQKTLQECFSDKAPNDLHNDINNEWKKYDPEYARYGLDTLENSSELVPFVISDNDLHSYISAIYLTGVGRVNSYVKALVEY